MNNSIYIGYAGSLANSKAMDIVGNNVSNINTTAFKGNNAEFSTLFENHLNTTTNNPTQSDQGTGSRIGSTTLDLTQGSLRESENIFNMAVNGDGWFGVTNDNIYNSNDISFTRDGTFSRNSESYLVNSNQNYLLGSDYGLIKQQENGTYIINNEIEPIAPTGEVGKQDKIFAPKELFYPHITTTSAVLQKNLYSESATQINNPGPGSDLKSLLTSSGELLDIKNNQDMLFSVGTSDAVYNNGKINYSFLASDDNESINNSAAFKINGSDINATWDEGADAATVAAAIQSAIDSSSITGISTSLSRNSVALIADDTISITDSDYGMIKPVLISKIMYSEIDSGPDRFTSLQDLSSIINSSIENTYGADSAEVFVSAKGEIKVAAKNEDVLLDFKTAANSNDKLLNNLNSLNGGTPKNIVSSSKEFAAAYSSSFQKIVNENGDNNLMYVNISQIEPKNGAIGSTWQTDVKIINEETATELTDAKELVLDGKEIALTNNQDMWISVGNGDIKKTTFGYDYTLKAPSDISNGTGSSLSFDINGININVTIPDGSSSSQTALNIASALVESGVNATASYGDVYIHADDKTPTLTISNGISDIFDFDIPSHTLQHTEYASTGKNSFTTLEDLNDLITNSAQNAGFSLNASIDESKFKIQNEGDEEVKYRVLNGLDSNNELLHILTPTYESVQPGKSSTTDTLSAHTIINEASRNITFDDSSQLSKGTTITIKNGSTDLVIDLSNMTSFASPQFNEYFSQNGEIEGTFDLYDINEKGQLLANFSNGKSVALSEVSLYHFQNDQGLEKTGNNQFIESANSGKPFFYIDHDGKVTNGAVIQNRMLENSNVSTEKALTEMIVLQRAFEGTAKIITTSDELLKNAINMKK